MKICSDLVSYCDIAESICVLLGVVGGVIEYFRRRKHAMYEVLSEYNDRYANDKNIEVVSKYLIGYLEGKEDSRPPTIYEKEMFLRFFEELQYQIDKGRIKKECVENFFVYYAVAAAMVPDFVHGMELENGNSEIWKYYRKLVMTFRDKMERSIAKDYSSHHNNQPTQLHVLIC